MTLDELAREYRAARRRTERRAKYLPLNCPAKTCRYCGRFWLQWKGSKLEGHAKCLVDETFRYLLRLFLSDPAMTYAVVSRSLGVSISVVRSWSFPIRSKA